MRGGGRLKDAGYVTGICGKWHLGDNHPLRPEDRGFQETLWSAGGGLAQPSDHPDTVNKTAYFDPVLKQNGKEVRTKGYCTDVFFGQATKWIESVKGKGEPFYCQITTNARPRRLSYDTGPRSRLSFEPPRLSPSTNTWWAGTFNGVCSGPQLCGVTTFGSR